MSNEILKVQEYMTKAQGKRLTRLRQYNLLALEVLIMIACAFGILYWITLLAYLFGIQLPVII